MGNNSNKQDVYLLGGHDAEMNHVKKKLEKNGIEYKDKNLGWGASIDDYKEEVNELLEKEKTPVAIELVGADQMEGIIDIDHHNEKSGRPAAIIQVMDRLGLKKRMFDELIAANDSGFIPAMERKIDEYKEQIVKKIGEEGFEKVKKNLVSLVRQKDRKAQGITKEQEKQAEEAIKNREDIGNLTIIRLPHSKTATVTDRLYGTYKNLLVLSEDGEINFFGDGKICQKLKDKYKGSWAGGEGLGKEGGNAFWGGYVDQKEVEENLKKNLGNSFHENDFNENINYRKKKYKLGDLDVSVQKEEFDISYYDGESRIRNMHSDFELLGISDFNEDLIKNKKLEIFTDVVKTNKYEEVENKIQELYKTLDKFESEQNRKIQEGRIEYLKKVLNSINKFNLKLKEILDNKDLFLEKLSEENPKILTLNSKEDFEFFQKIADGNIVGLFRNGSFQGYFESLEKVGKFKYEEIPSYEKYISQSGITERIKENINSGVSVNAGEKYIDIFLKKLEENGYEYEKIGRSGFESRNSYKVKIPTKKQEVLLIKYGDIIKKGEEIEEFKEKKIFICGKKEIDIVYEIEREKVKKILEESKKEFENQKINFFNEKFLENSHDGGVTGVLEIGGDLDLQYPLPDGFIEIASKRIVNTQDYRQGRDHTYRSVILNKNKVQEGKILKISVPDEFKGLVIGKGGKNIKRIAEEIGVNFIKVK